MATPGNPYSDDRIKTFTIPVSGSVVLYGPEIDVIQSREFQRLAGIKQLGTSYVVFRGALHTRFEHSVGCLHEAARMIEAMRTNPRAHAEVDLAAERLARLGALLHDLPHIPFGHTLEDEFHLLQRHDENKSRIHAPLVDSRIGEILTAAIGADEFDELERVLSAKDDEEFANLRYPFVGDIVGNTVCADLLDYVVRDLTACGMPVAMGDRFLDYLTVTSQEEGRRVDHERLVLNLDKRGMPRPDVESEIVKLLSYRYELAERVYFHHAKNAASVMIARAVQEAGFAQGIASPEELDRNFRWLSDELLLHSLADQGIAEALHLVSAPDAGDRNLAVELSQRVLGRDLFKIAYLAVHDDIADGAARVCDEFGNNPERRRQLEDRFADGAGVPRGSVLVHIPRQQMMRKKADVRVRTSSDDIITLNEWDARHSGRIEALNQAHVRLWRVTVYVDPRYLSAVEVVRGLAEDEFRSRSRYLPAGKRSAYTRALFESLAEQWELDLGDLAAVDAVPARAEGAETRVEAESVIIEQIRLQREAQGRAPLKQRTEPR